MTDSWIGGDLSGINAMGTAMDGAPAKIKHIVTDLSSGTDKLVGDAGFSGDAADQFKRRWTEDALTAGALAAGAYGAYGPGYGYYGGPRYYRSHAYYGGPRYYRHYRRHW